MKLALSLRGHLRGGLVDSRMRDYITLLENQGHVVDIYCHTWAESEAKTSYRSLDHNGLFDVKESHLVNYFGAESLKKIWIEDDATLELHGATEGNLPGGRCPLIAWKRMWAGKHVLASYLYRNHQSEYDRVISTRYDLFTTPVCYTPTKNLLKITRETCRLSLKYPKYYRLLKGVDNYYVGDLDVIYDIACAFHLRLDDILKAHDARGFHEERFYKYVQHSGCLE